MNKLAWAAGALMISGSAAAEFSANIGATSNYVWRGVTQTDDQAAISGGLDYAHDNGFYAGTWASNVDFDDDTNAEVDFYAGFGNEVNDFGYDVGLLYYYYPGGDNIDFADIYASLSYGPVTGGVNYIVHSDVKKTSGINDTFIEGDIYYFLSASFDVAETWSVGGTFGYFDFREDGKFDAVVDDKVKTSYKHFQLEIGKSVGDFGDFTFSVSKADKESGDDDPKV
ncbi:MAG: TorF family putative porin, partial [Alphaproteobacteria bacterium]|nr:TorF family putative porin [Alphaproteobacteria bacterium]